MSYIGSVPTTAAFPFDQFSGNGTTTAFTLTYAPASTTSIIVAISGVVQNPNLYSVIGTTITFSPAPPTGTNNISVLYLGLPVIGVSNPGNTAYFSSTSFTATGGQTTFTPSGSYTPGFINVIRNGAQLAPANYTATNGTTVTLANACTAGDIVVIEVFTLTSISNALPLTGGTVTGQSTFNAGVNLAVSSGNVGIGTSSPGTRLQLGNNSNASELARFANTLANFDVGVTAGGCQLYTANNQPIVFSNNAAERARIDSSGNLLVGVASGTSHILSKNASSGYVAGVDNSASTTPFGMYVNFSAAAPNDTSRLFLSCADTSATRATIRSNGGIANFSANNVNLSDRREKANFAPAGDYLSKICAIPVQTFNYIDQNMEEDPGLTLGVVAQDVQEVAPELVMESNWGTEEEPKMRLSIYQTDLQYALMKAIQEQQQIIETLQAKVAALENLP